MADEEPQVSEEEMMKIYEEAYKDVPEEEPATDDGTRRESTDNTGNGECYECGDMEPVEGEGDAQLEQSAPPEELVEDVSSSEKDELEELLGMDISLDKEEELETDVADEVGPIEGGQLLTLSESEDEWPDLTNEPLDEE